MPYEIESSCAACRQGDRFMIGNWPEHLGVYVCSVCKALTNISVETPKCPGCGQLVEPQDCYDYSFAIPYLGGQFLREPEPGPNCPNADRGLWPSRTTFTSTWGWWWVTERKPRRRGGKTTSKRRSS